MFFMPNSRTFKTKIYHMIWQLLYCKVVVVTIYTVTIFFGYTKPGHYVLYGTRDICMFDKQKHVSL